MMTPNACIELAQNGRTVHCAGKWTIAGVESLPATFTELFKSSTDHLQINLADVTELDTVGAFRLHQLLNEAEQSGKKISLEGLSQNHQLIFDLLEKNLKKVHPEQLIPPKKPSELETLGRWSVEKYQNFIKYLSFLGEIIVKFFTIRSRGVNNLISTGLKIIQTAGCQALPIVGMLSFLIGVVLAYQLGVQLKLYGADIYVVDASGIAILREFSPLITAVIIAGRTSTAFAALIGAMKVNDELDALATMGVSSVERLVLPRVLGLLIALPLLVVWSNFFSILGCMLMVKGQLNIGYIAFLDRFKESVELKHYVLGMVKTPVFAVIISTVGCFQGFQAGITADSVGLKTTAAAVQAIFLIIVSDAFFSVLYSWRGL